MLNRRKVEVGSWFRGAWNKNPTRKYRREPPSFASVFLTAFSCRGASIARHAPGFLDRAHAGLDIPGAERAQVDHLHLDAIPTQPGGRLHSHRPHVPIRHRGQVLALADDRRATEG